MRSRVAGLLIAAGCGGHASTPDASPFPPVAPTRDVDVLFVIGSEESMGDAQTVLAGNLPSLVAGLDALPGGRPDLHLGVIDSSVDLGVAGLGASCSPATLGNGLLRNAATGTPGCPTPIDRFISDVANGSSARTTNYPGTLDDVLTCIVQVGTTGCGFIAPLEAMKRALDGSRPENAGFRRAGAVLAVVILSDEDDCSASDPSLFTLDKTTAGDGSFRCTALGYTCDQPISVTQAGSYGSCVPRNDYLTDPRSYAAFLETLVNPAQLVVTVIAAPASTSIETIALTQGPAAIALAPTCTAPINGDRMPVDPSIRLLAFANATSSPMLPTMCQSDYSALATAIAVQIGVAMTAAP